MLLAESAVTYDQIFEHLDLYTSVYVHAQAFLH